MSVGFMLILQLKIRSILVFTQGIHVYTWNFECIIHVGVLRGCIKSSTTCATGNSSCIYIPHDSPAPCVIYRALFFQSLLSLVLFSPLEWEK